MDDFSGSERRRLRELAGTARERELDAALEDLDRHFEEWRSGGIRPSDLSRRIHEFHDDEARELHSLYDRVDEAKLVARALARGLLDEEEVGPDLASRLEPAVGFFREQSREGPEL